MDVLKGLIERVLPCVKDANVTFTVKSDFAPEHFRVYFDDGGLRVEADTAVAAAHGFYRYLKEICRVNLSWNGNREIEIESLTPFDGEIVGTIEQKYRVYMNYCTLNYTASWWDFARWEREIDFMALNGINMPLAVIGTEAVWFETFVECGLTEEESLNSITGPAFWAWQLMTNIEGYLPPKDKKYVYERLELGRKIIGRMLEYGMFPIQQGFSGHVPTVLKEKYPEASIAIKRGWCCFKETAQLDPLDPLFKKIGRLYLEKQEKLIGNYGFYAADPFHENAPPVKGDPYLTSVGRAIFEMFDDYDADSTWVMQAWSIRDKIAEAVPRGRLLILDLDSKKYKPHKYFRGHDFVLGTLHNFGGKNALQGRPYDYAVNSFTRVKKKRKANAVGTGLFMEGIEQNPYIYDLLFAMLTAPDDKNLGEFTRDYIIRRYGRCTDNFMKAYDVLLKTCYKRGSRDDSAIGTMLAARPDYMPFKASPCDMVRPYYKKGSLSPAAKAMYAEHDNTANTDGYYYDLVDITRQAMSDLFYLGQAEFNKAAKVRDFNKMSSVSERQLDLLDDLDELLGYRSEFCLDRWLYDAAALANDGEERRYFDLNARSQITLWGDIDGDDVLFDYAWKEWSGLISGYYRIRWEKFYRAAIEAAKSGKRVKTFTTDMFFGRPKWKTTDFYKELAVFEREWAENYREVTSRPVDRDPSEFVGKTINKWFSR